MSAFFPSCYVDEVMPPDRESPDAWLSHLDDGAPALDACETGGTKRILKDGEIVEFTERDDIGEAELTLAADQSWTVTRSMPAGNDVMCCIMEGYQIETVSTSLEDAVSALIECGGAPDTYLVSYYIFVDDIRYQYDAKTHSFTREMSSAQRTA